MKDKTINYSCVSFGSETTKIASAQFNATQNNFYFTAINAITTKGYKKGYPEDESCIIETFKKSIKAIEDSTSTKIENLILGLSGIGLQSTPVLSSIIINKADNEVTKLDKEKLEDIAKKQIEMDNKIVLGVYAIEYKIDGKICYGDPIGAKGIRIECQSLVVHYPKQYIDIFNQLNKYEINIKHKVPLIESYEYLLTENERISGSIIIEIGHDVTTFIVVENDTIIMLVSIPSGGRDISGDIATSLKITLDEADQIKKGTSVNFGAQRIVEDVINKRLFTIFESINIYLKKINRQGLLPGGCVLVGGNAKIHNIENIAKKHLGMPVRVPFQEFKTNTKYTIKDISWYTICNTITEEFKKNTSLTDPENKLFVKTKKFWKKYVYPYLP